MKQMMMATLNWLNDEKITAPRDGDRVMLGWRDLNPAAAGDAAPMPFGKIEMAVYVVALLVAFPVLAFSADLPVLKSDVKRGDIITADNVYYKDMGTLRTNDRTVVIADDLIGMEALRTVRAGRPLMTNYVRIKPAVRKGEVVRMSYQTEGLTLQGQGRVQEDALVGDTVKLTNIDSNKVLHGRVLAVGHVRIN